MSFYLSDKEYETILGFVGGNSGKNKRDDVDPYIDMPQVSTQKDKQGAFADTVDAVQMGAWKGLGDVAHGLGALTNSEWFHEVGDWAAKGADENMKSMSPEMQEAMGQNAFDGGGKGVLNLRWWAGNLGALIGQNLDAVATLGAGKAVSMGVKQAGKMLSKEAAEDVGKVAVEQAAKRGIPQRYWKEVGVTATFSAMSAGSRYGQKRDDVMAMSNEELANVPQFSDAYYEIADSEQGKDKSVAEIYEMAKVNFADRVGRSAAMNPTAIVTDLTTNAVSGLGGGFLGVGKPAGTVKGGLLKGAMIEGGTEAIQGVGEQYALNKAEQDYYNPNKSITDGMADNAVNGAVLGSVFGSAMGGLDSFSHGRAIQKQKRVLMEHIDTGNEMVDEQLRNYVDMVNRNANSLDELVSMSHVNALNSAGIAKAQAIREAEVLARQQEQAQAEAEEEIEQAQVMPEVDLQYAANVAPDIRDGIISGLEDEIDIGNGNYQPFKYEVLDASLLAPTQQKDLNQFRDRERVASQAQINHIARNLDPRKLVSSPTMDIGAPLLALDGKTIIAGNGRSMAIRQAYQEGNAGQYAQFLKDNADKFGLSQEQLEAVQNPVLVRRLTAPVDIAQVAISSNEQGGMRMSDLEQAKVDARRLPSMDAFSVGENGDINSADNQSFIRSFIQNQPENLRNELLDSKGELSQTGIKRVRNAILYQAYGDSQTLSRLVENTEQGAKNILNALTSLAPETAQIQQDINSGALSDVSISNDIIQAVEKYNQLNAQGMKVEDYLAQDDFIGDLTPEAREVLTIFNENKRSGKRIAEILKSYYAQAQAQGNLSQGSMFGDAAFDKLGTLYQAKNVKETLFSLNENANSDFAKAVDTTIQGGKPSKQYIPIGSTPNVLKILGLPDTKVLVSRDVLRKVMLDKHNVTAETLKQLPKQINNPVAVMKSSPQATQSGYVVLTELLERNTSTGKNEPVISALHLKKAKDGIEVINIASIYGKNLSGVQNMLNHDLVYWNKTKGSQFIESFGLQLPSKIDSKTMSQSVNNIKTESDLSQYQSQQNQSALSNNEAFKQILTKAVGKSAVENIEVVRSGVKPDGAQSLITQDVEGWFNPRTGKIALVEDGIRATKTMTREERIAWVAWHELAHRGVNVRYKNEYSALMQEVGKNKIINQLAAAIREQRKGTDDSAVKNYSIAVEEAIAEVMAAHETGKWNELETRYGIEVKPMQRTSTKSWLAMTAQRIKAFLAKIFGSERAGQFSDEDVLNLVAKIKQSAVGNTTENGDVRFSRNEELTEERYNQAKAEGKTELTFRQWQQVRSPEFKVWFGDWENDPENASKVINHRTGEPLVVYHGTLADFSSFNNDKNLYFVSESNEFVEKFITQENGELASGSNIMPVFVVAKKPFDYENKKQVNQLSYSASLSRNAESEIKKGKWQRIEDRQILETIKRMEFDGVYVKEDGYKNLAVFSANQIKSAIGNTGAFSRDNDDIRFSRNSDLAMDFDSRMARARELGFNTDYYYRHGTYEKNPIERIKPNESFGGLFSMQNEFDDSRPDEAPYGDHYEDFVIKGEPMDSYEFRNIIHDSEQSVEEAKDFIAKEAGISKSSLSEEEWGSVLDLITEDESLWDFVDYSTQEAPGYLQKVFRYQGDTEPAYLDWGVQRLRMALAKKYGAAAIEMKDENGTSIALLPGNGVRSVEAEFNPENADSDNLRFSRSNTVQSALDLADSAARVKQDVGFWADIKSGGFESFKHRVNIIAGKVDEWLADSLRPVNDWIDSREITDREKHRLKDAMYTAKGKRDALNSELEQAYLKPILKKIADMSKKTQKNKSPIDEITMKRKVGNWISARYSIEKNLALLETDKKAVDEIKSKLEEARKADRTAEVKRLSGEYRRAVKKYDDRKLDIYNKEYGKKKDRFKVGVAGGWSIPEAELIMARTESHINRLDLEAVAEMVYNLNAARLEIDKASGRYMQKEYQAFKENRHYVPLTGDPNADADSDVISGAGSTSVNIGRDKALKGRTDSEAEDAIDAVWKSISKSTTYAGFSDFKAKLDELYEGEVAMLTEQGYSEQQAKELATANLGISKRKMQGLTRSSDNVLIRKEGGQYYEYELPERVIEAFKNDNVEYANSFLKVLSKPTGLYARGVTQWTVTFAPMNMMRDTWEKSEFVRVQKLYDKDGELIDDKAMDKIGRALLKNAFLDKDIWVATKRLGFGQELRNNVEHERLLKQLMKDGGLSNYGTYLAKTETDLVAKLKRENNPIANKLEMAGKILEGYNKTFDAVSALSAYKALIDNGVDSKQAAAVTLELTNFRKTGSKMKGIKALYMFSQPTVMGAANLIRYLSTNKGQKRFVGYLAVMTALYTVLRSMDDEDEGGNKMDQLGDITRYIPIPVGGGHYIKIPVGFGLPQMAWNFATNMVKGTAGDISFMDAGANMLVHSMKTFSPVSPSEISAAKYPMEKLALTATPSILQPLMQNVLNRSAFGNKITTNYVRDDKLKSEQSKSTTAKSWKEAAIAIHDYLGIDMHPEQVKNIVDGYSGMLGSLREALFTIGVENPNREMLGRKTRVPFLNQLLGTTNEFAIQSRYYEASEEARSVFKEYESRKQRGKLEGWLNEDRRRLIKFHQQDESVVKTMRSEKAKLTRALRTGKISSIAYENGIKRYNKDMSNVQAKMLHQYRIMESLNTN